MADQASTVDAYIASFPAEVRSELTKIRSAIREALPDAEESITYQIPTYKVDGSAVIFFAGWKKYISVYPVPNVDAAMEKKIGVYRAQKSTLRFPLGQPIPYEVIGQLAVIAGKQARRGR
jgi:uncharacterized protein YdhG (YjbR/CyaY superfamily)